MKIGKISMKSLNMEIEGFEISKEELTDGLRALGKGLGNILSDPTIMKLIESLAKYFNTPTYGPPITPVMPKLSPEQIKDLEKLAREASKQAKKTKKPCCDEKEEKEE